MSDPGPNRCLARSQYRKRAEAYDRRTRLLAGYRRRAIERLLLGSGDTVIDVACGTGANFELLEQYIGPTGKIIGVDLSPEMLALARERTDRYGWRNVTLVEGAVEDATLEAHADAALFSFTHDVLQSARAVANVMRALKAGARVVAVGAKLASGWRFPVNVAVWLVSRPYVTTFAGIRRPWSKLEPYLRDLSVDSVAAGGGYIAAGSRELGSTTPEHG